MKKKMMAILMAVLMLGALVAVPAWAESNVIYYEPFNADFSGTAIDTVFSVGDPTTPEGQTPTNYCLPVKANASNGGERQKPCMTIDIKDENGKAIPFASGIYKISYRAYCADVANTCFALYTEGSINKTSYPHRYFMNYAMNPQTIAGEWTDFSIVFYLPETLEKDGAATKITTLMINLDNNQAKKPIYYDDFKLEKMEDAFFYVKDTTYTSYVPTTSSKDNGYYNGEIQQEQLLGISRGAEITALTGETETIRPVFIERSAKLGDKVTVIHAIYEMKNGKKSLYAVEITEATKNLRNVLVSEDKEINVPAKTADKCYELKSFIWDSASGLKALGNVSSLSLAQTE